MKIYFDNVAQCDANKFNYVVNFIRNHPYSAADLQVVNSAESAEQIVRYGEELGNANYLIPSQRLIFNSAVVDSQKLFANKSKFEELILYSVASESKPTQAFLQNNKFGFDIIEMIFFHLSRYEEYHCRQEDRDRWDMMNEENQFLVRHNIEKRPVVDHLVKCFLLAIGVTPKAHVANVRVTHDIDLLRKFKSPLSFARFNAYYIRHGFTALKELWASYYRHVLQGEEAYQNLDEILTDKKIEKEIYFIVGGNDNVDTPLDIESKAFKDAIAISKSRNYMIGIHPSYNCWENEDLLKSEKETLENEINDTIKISRQHYLHFSFDKTIKILENAGIEQDSTLGFNSRIGFRAGTGNQFRLYDLSRDIESSITEQPLAYMDSSLFVEADFNGEKAEQLSESFFENNRNWTSITCNFHNSRFDDALMYKIPLLEMYRKLLSV